MEIAIILIIGAVIYLLVTHHSADKPAIPPTPSKEDKEFEEVFFSGASGKDIDDF